MSGSQFSFGPNGSYFLKSDTTWAWSEGNLPDSLRLVLTDPRHPYAMKEPFDVALGMDPGTYSVFYRSTSDQVVYEDECVGADYAKLAEYLKTQGIEGGQTMRTVFGPNGSYFTSSPAGFSWQNLPAPMETDIQSRLKKAVPGVVALGVHGSYVVLYADARMCWNLEGRYPEVEALLRDQDEIVRHNGISYIALNPHAEDQFYIVYADGSTRWALPPEWTDDVQTVSGTIRPIRPALQGMPGLIQAGGNFAVQAQAARISHLLF